jgi:hypothetical protein
VNGDGYGDVVANTIGEQENSVPVYLGSAAGLAASPVAAATDPNNNVCIGTFASSVASAGDVNGDGFADVVVGAPSECGRPNSAPEAAYIYLGNVRGLAATPATTLLGVGGGYGRFGISVFGASD